MQVYRFRSPHPNPAMRYSYALLVANWWERIALRRLMRRHQGLAPVSNMPYTKALGASFVLRAKPDSTLRRNSDFVQSSWHGHDAAPAEPREPLQG
jgi:hypothetical protein